MATNTVILVDKSDKVIGTEEKMKVHREGKLHRCFSIFVFNKIGELLLQQRALDKYHCGGLWSNTCCSHQKPGEDEEITIHERLKEEMGFDCNLQKKFIFHYNAKFHNGLSENEIDHAYFGTYNGTPKPNPEEVMDWKWVHPAELHKAIASHPERFTIWLKKALLLPKCNSPGTPSLKESPIREYSL